MDYFAALGAFLRSVELGSFSKAAAETGTKVSTVSRYISGLESDLGVALFNRSTRGLHLTEAGQTFYDRSKQIVADLDEARSTAAAFNSRPCGLLRINIPSGFGRRHVMPHMKDFLSLYPDIKLDATLTDATVDLIESGADLAVRIGALSDSRLVARRMAPLQRILVASPAYLEGRPPVQEPEDLKVHECVRFALEARGSWFCRAAGGTAMREITIDGHMRTNDAETLRDAALSGLGIALLPTWLVGEDVRAGRLQSLLPHWEWFIAPGPERAIWIVYPPKKVVSPKVRTFMDFLAERYGKPPYWDRPG